jgi:outer membrane receptor protein involved in Fe transport
VFLTAPKPTAPCAKRARLCAFPLVVLMLACGFADAAAADLPKQIFDLPADSAEKSIRRFAEQSGLEVFYPSSATRGMRTPAVRGEMTPREALDALLAGSGLVVVRDERSGAFSLRRDETATAKPGAGGAAAPLARSSIGAPGPARGIPAAPEELGPAILLSPFEVVSEQRGYHAANTLSGTRLNAKLEDLAAPISVVTREQIEDFALLDLNDVFLHEAGTEGTGNYTDFLFNRNFEPASGTELTPLAANRIRGLDSVNTTWGNFETSGRVPLDPLNFDAIEISRGPNASIFGIGSPAGSVNAVPATASLARDTSRLAFRADSFGGHRGSLDLNRVLKPGFALRGSAAFQRHGFDLKPSGLATVRLNGMARYRPFRTTMITGSYSAYRMHGTRPNVIPPRETITGWLADGAPTWDPVARTVRREGAVIETFPDVLPAYLSGAPHGVFTNYYVEPHGIGHVSSGRTTSAINPNLASANLRQLVNIANDPAGTRSVQPLYARIPSAVDKSLYDWSSINLAAANRVEDRAVIANVMWDQVILETPRQLLATQAGWFRELTDNYDRSPIGAPSNVTSIAALHVDINERLLDGTPNPYFRRPFFGATTPYHVVTSMDRDTYRGQVAYRLDLRRGKSSLRWLGLQQVTGYGEYKEVVSRKASFYHAVVGKHAWLGAGTAHAGRGNAIGGLPVAGPNIALGYFRHYLGDDRGYNVDYAPGRFAPGTYALNYGNPADGFVRESITVGPAPYAVGGPESERMILKSRGVILQSHLLDDRVVTTLGLRHDWRYSRSGAGFRLLPDGVTIDHAFSDRWASGDWDVGAAPTRTAGIVVKPASWLSLHANRSDSFQPMPVNQDLDLRVIPDPTGEGTDYGFSLNLFQGKLHLRANRYATNSFAQRDDQTRSPVIRLRGIDFADTNSGRDLQTMAAGWVDREAAAAGIVLMPEERLARTAAIMQLPVDYLRPTAFAPNAAEDHVATGTEIEIHINPTNYWTLKANLVRQESIVRNVAPEANRWIAERTKVWRTIIDPSTGRPWFTERYGLVNSGSEYLDQFVLAPLALVQALEGKSRSQIRSYRANVASSLRLSGLTDQAILSRCKIGAALRWEGKGIIGYHGRQQQPEIVTLFDGSRPILDRPHLNADAYVSYRTTLFSDKVTATWQLNVRNVNESGRLQPIAADPDGVPSAYRIVSPRQFILGVTFEL